MLTTAILSLLHVLVFVYWLGGDLGAFYASRYLTKPDVSRDRRMLAATMVGDVDMAPRTALILALPTGLALAEAKGWITIGWPFVAVVVLVSAAWLAIAWQRHLNHGAPNPMLQNVDMGLRWALVGGLSSAAVAGAVGLIDLPTFLAVKFVALAGCVLMGLIIRRTLTPLFPALGALAGGGDTAAAEATIAQTLIRARPQVKVIWTLLLIAALFGLWTPSL
ncbi:MAG: hypothetical protein AAGH41_08430 [Pseudomonadota bacterium]